MPRQYTFTSAAMAAALEETPITYEELADIEREFEDAETEIGTSSNGKPIYFANNTQFANKSHLQRLFTPAAQRQSPRSPISGP
jgi:hypothetical protein